MSAYDFVLIALLTLAFALAWAVFFAPVYLSFRVEAGVGLSPEWAAGVGWGPGGIVVRHSAVPGERERAEIFLLSRRVFSFSLPAKKEKEETPPKKKEKKPGGPSALDRTLTVLERVDRHWGLGEVLTFLIRERKRLVVDDLSGRIRYGFEEYERTGLVNGYLWALQGAAGPAFRLQHEPDWSGRNVFAGGVHARLRLYLVLLLLDFFLFFVAKTRWTAPRNKARAALAARTSRSESP